MPKASDLLSSTPPKILIYGNPGTSKTVSTMTLGPLLELIDCDGGFSSGVTTKDQFQSRRQQVEVCSCVDSGPMTADGFEKAKNRILAIHNLIVQKKYPYQAVCLDSVTTLGESCMKAALIGDNRWANGRKIEIQNYGLAVPYLQQIFNLLRGLPIPVIVIAHDYTKEGTKDNPLPRTQLVTVGNKLGNILPAYFDEVWYAKITGANSTQNYVYQTTPTATVMARSRRNLPNGTNTNLGMVKIFEMLGWTFKPEGEPATPPSVGSTPKP